MSQIPINMNDPEDCLKIISAGLEKSNKCGALTLEDAFLMHLALKNLKEYMANCKDHVCPKITIEEDSDSKN